ncbi:phage tail protein [Marinobacter alkaliphilus]|uniref:Phage tail protein n=1 Tax=Marinobacter alkaliphilus TaxID=254719 RepID=A0ABZ3E5X7_9GAMM
MPSFYTILTDVGQAKLANAIALGQTIEITDLAVGDGNGSLPTPETSRIALVNEVRRAPINLSDVDDQNPSWVVVEQVLPPDVGGWTIREIGIFDVDGDLIGYGNYPETYKPVLAEGSSRTQTIRFVMEVSDTQAITLKVDPSVVLATRRYVDDVEADAASALDAHSQSNNHPTATESAKGMVMKASTAQAISGTAGKFPDAAGVHAAFKQFGLGAYKAVPVPLNELTVPGFYNAPGSDPNGFGSGTYVLVGGNAVALESGGGAYQIGVNIVTKELYWRALHAGSWSPWREFAHSGNFSMVGSIAAFAMSSAPVGWVKANGAAVSRTAYADLYAAIGTTYGPGDGSSTFNLPDLRGEFIRGVDDGRGVDAGRSLGSYQTDQVGQINIPSTANDNFELYHRTTATDLAKGDGGANLSDLVLNAGAETRPRNTALLFCIKY